MKVLIREAKIIDKASSHHGKIADVLINKGIIAEIGKNLKAKADKTVDGKGKILTPGWFDLKAQVGDPGFEHKEDLNSVAEAALAGGFTGLAILPNNKPVTQTKNDINYIRSKSHSGVEFHPIGAVTIDTKGEDLTEMI
ncbi:MAG: dihydroorotase, partial [Fulvivirga sp.]|nr:dihydroorotase [Fulvivirga sp.]